MTLELEGKIYLSYEDDNGETIKDELDGDLCLKMLALVTKEAIEEYMEKYHLETT